jgi:hypothetical protein
MDHWGEVGYVLCATASNLLMRNWLLQQIWWCTIGHWGKFVSDLWATVANLWIRWGLLHGMNRTVKICDDFHTVGHYTVCVYVLWAITQDLIMVMGHNEGFCYMQLAIVQDFVTLCAMCRIWLCIFGHSAKKLPRGQNHTILLKSLVNSLKEQWG